MAARLDPAKNYGVWWFNRRRHESRHVAESGPDGERRYRRPLEELERDRDALLESYAGMMPEALDSLAPEERCQVYGMLRLKVEILADGSMEARGALSETLQVLYENGQVVCENGLASGCDSRFTKPPELTFHAILSDGAREMRFEWARG